MSSPVSSPNDLTKEAPKLLGALGLPGLGSGEEEAIWIGTEQRQIAADVAVEELRGFFGQRVFMADTVLHLGLVENDDDLVARSDDVLAELQRDEIVAPDRSHQEELQADSNLHEPGVIDRGIARSAQAVLDAVRQEQQLLDIGAIGELPQCRLGLLTQSRRARRHIGPEALEPRESVAASAPTACLATSTSTWAIIATILLGVLPLRSR